MSLQRLTFSNGFLSDNRQLKSYRSWQTPFTKTIGTPILVLGGFIASFFTFGSALIVSAVGFGVGAAGGLTMTGAKVAENMLSTSKIKLVQQAIDEDREASEALRSCLEEVEQFFASNSALFHSILQDPRRIEDSDTERVQAMFQVLFPDDPDDEDTRSE